jgi:two-component system, OmpR family, response regulator
MFLIGNKWRAEMSTLLANTTVLVVDDDQDTCELLRASLEKRGANVVAVNSEEAALAAYRVHPPDIILSDMRLGSSDGYALIAAIREYNREYRGFTPAIALTGFQYPGDEERAIAAGFDAYIHKPFNPQHVIGTITRLLREQRQRAA